MARVVKREFEDIESLIKRWKRKVNDDMVLAELKKREFYKTKSQKRREKRKAAILKKQKQERMQAKYLMRNKDDKAYAVRKETGRRKDYNV